MNIRILTWNVHGLPWPVTRNRPLRMKRIGERIVEEAVDVALLQEVWAGAVAQLQGGARDYRSAFVPTMFGSAAGGLLVLVREGSGFDLEAASVRFRRFARHAPRRRIREGDGLAGKGALCLTLAHTASGQHLSIVNTHLQARYRRNDYADIRLAQLRELAGWLGESSDPAIVAGDLNTPAGEQPAYGAIAALGVDLSEEARAGSVTNYPLHSSAAWIDYVLLRPGTAGWSASPLRMIENESIDHPYSDHSALLVDVELDFDADERSFHGLAGLVP